MNKLLKFSLTAFVYQALLVNLHAQKNVNKFGVSVIANKTTYLSSIQADSAKKMIGLKKLIPSLRLDLRYARSSNFTNHRLYPTHTRETYLRAPAAYALASIQKTLEKEGLGIIIFDAYRPYSVTVRFWELIGDERFVAHPAKASGHNRGLAVDISLINLSSGKLIEMGTDFDHFSDTAFHSFNGLPQTMLRNRKKLLQLMTQAGFQALETEWWHYSWPNTMGAEPLDIPFNKF